MRVTIVHKKPDHNATTPSDPCHEVEVCRRKEVSETEITMVPFFENRAEISKGTYTRSPCEYWHPPEWKPGISVSSRIKRLMCNQRKKSKERLSFPTKKRKRRQECCGYFENCTTMVLCLARRKPDAKSLGTNSKSMAHSSKYPGKERTIAWKSASPTFSSAKSLRCESEDRSQDCKTTAMRPKQGMEPCQKHSQAQRERQNDIPLALGRMGTPGCVGGRAGEWRVCGGFRSQCAHGQQKSLLSWTP